MVATRGVTQTTDEPPSSPEAEPSRDQDGVCPECEGRGRVRDERRGEVACARCGLVLAEGAIDQGPDWRAFDAQQREARARAGPARTVLRHDHGLGTRIGHRGETSKAKSSSELRRMRRYHRQATYRPGADQGLVRALHEVERLTGALGLPDVVAELAARIYRQAREDGFLHGRRVEDTAAASVYAAARICGNPRPLDDVIQAAQGTEHDVARTYRKLSQALSLQVPITQPTDLLPAFASRLELPAPVETRAREMLEDADPGRFSGKHPASVAAAALYAAGKAADEARSQSEVAEAAGVTEVTVRARLRDLEDACDPSGQRN